MQCKFESLSLFISLEIHSLYGQKHRKICICMTKCRAGFATDIGSLGKQQTIKRTQRDLRHTGSQTIQRSRNGILSIHLNSIDCIYSVS